MPCRKRRTFCFCPRSTDARRARAARMLFRQYPARPWPSPAPPVSFSFRAISFLFSARSRAWRCGLPLFPADPPATAASPPPAAFTSARNGSGTAVPRPAPSWRPGRQGSSSLSRTSCLVLLRLKKNCMPLISFILTERARWFHPARMMATLASRPRIRI